MPRKQFVLLFGPVFVLLMSLFCAEISLAGRGSTNDRIQLAPHFRAGEDFHYNIQLHTVSTMHSIGPISDPGGPTSLDQSVNVVLGLEVLSAGGTSAVPGDIRIRATYEKSAATTKSDSYDPENDDADEQYEKLAGHSIDFSLSPDGKVQEVSGLNKLVADPSRAAVIRQWFGQLTLSAALPRRGIAIGEKWTTKQPLQNMPLTGLVLRTESTYLRNETCPEAGLDSVTAAGSPRPASPSPPRDECAVILTHTVISGPHGRKDRTPEVYKQNGLRTFGEWTGTVDGLTSISLRTGMVTSATQAGSTKMDFTILSVANQNTLHYVGEVHTQSQISMISEASAP